MCVSCIQLLGILILLLRGKIGANIFEEKRAYIFPDNYDKYEPPWEKENPTQVYIKLLVMDIDDINDGKMEYSIQFYLTEIWKDARLNLTSFLGGKRNVNFPSYFKPFLWEPDIVFDNAKDGKLFHLSLPNTQISITKKTELRKLTRYNLVVSCPMDFHFYPMDTQECYLKFSSLANPDYKFILKWHDELPGEEDSESIWLMYPIEPLKYVMRKPLQKKVVEVWDDGNYTFLSAKFVFNRRLSSSLFNVYIPSTLVVILSWISFWVDINAVPARVTLGVTSLLTLSTQVMQARDELPPISYLTAMDVWLFVCLIFVFSALLEFSFSYQSSNANKQSSVASATSQGEKQNGDNAHLKRSSLAKDVFQRNRIAQVASVDSPKMNINNLDSICRKVFPSLFTLFALIYWCYYLHLK